MRSLIIRKEGYLLGLSEHIMSITVLMPQQFEFGYKSRTMNKVWTILKSNNDYEIALERLDDIFDAVPGSDEDKESDLLVLLIEKYEQDNFPIPDPDPIEAIKFIMEQNSLKQQDLVGIIGDKTTVSKVLQKKRKLTIQMIRNLNRMLQIPFDALIKDYELA